MTKAGLFLADLALTLTLQLLMGLILLVPLPVGCFLGRLLGRLSYYILPKQRRRCLRHLALVYRRRVSAPRLKSLARRCLAHFGQAFVESVHARKIFNRRSFRRYIHIHNEHYLREAAASGKGVLCVTGHLGNWEILGMAMGSMGIRVCSLYKPLGFPRMDRLMRRMREHHGQVLVPVAGGVGRLLRELRAGNTVAALADQRVRNGGLYVEFLGLPTSVSGLVGILALRAECPVVQGYAVRRGRGFEYDVYIEPPLDVWNEGDPRRNVLRTAQAYMTGIEEHVRQCPEQYMWLHKQWRRSDIANAAPLLREVRTLGLAKGAPMANYRRVGREPESRTTSH